MKKSILVVMFLVFVGTSIAQATLMGFVGQGKDVYLTNFETGQFINKIKVAPISIFETTVTLFSLHCYCSAWVR